MSVLSALQIYWANRIMCVPPFPQQTLERIPCSTAIRRRMCALLAYASGGSVSLHFSERQSLSLAQTLSQVITVPGMPTVIDCHNLYSETTADHLSPAVAGAMVRVYVPNVLSNDVDIIDPSTRKVVDHFKSPGNPQHVVPSWDLKTLWVVGSGRHHRYGSLTPIDPSTAKPSNAIKVPDAYNLYFTPDGASAIVVAEGLKRLEFCDPHTMALQSGATSSSPASSVAASSKSTLLNEQSSAN